MALRKLKLKLTAELLRPLAQPGTVMHVPESPKTQRTVNPLKWLKMSLEDFCKDYEVPDPLHDKLQKLCVLKDHMLFAGSVMMTFAGKVAWHLVNWELCVMLNNVGKTIALGMTSWYFIAAFMVFCSHASLLATRILACVFLDSCPCPLVM